MAEMDTTNDNQTLNFCECYKQFVDFLEDDSNDKFIFTETHIIKRPSILSNVTFTPCDKCFIFRMRYLYIYMFSEDVEPVRIYDEIIEAYERSMYSKVGKIYSIFLASDHFGTISDTSACSHLKDIDLNEFIGEFSPKVLCDIAMTTMIKRRGPALCDGTSLSVFCVHRCLNSLEQLLGYDRIIHTDLMKTEETVLEEIQQDVTVDVNYEELLTKYENTVNDKDIRDTKFVFLAISEDVSKITKLSDVVSMLCKLFGPDSLLGNSFFGRLASVYPKVIDYISSHGETTEILRFSFLRVCREAYVLRFKELCLESSVGVVNSKDRCYNKKRVPKNYKDVINPIQ